MSNNNTLTTLDQVRFYKLLKYVAGVQNGLSIDQINPEESGK